MLKRFFWTKLPQNSVCQTKQNTFILDFFSDSVCDLMLSLQGTPFFGMYQKAFSTTKRLNPKKGGVFLFHIQNVPSQEKKEKNVSFRFTHIFPLLKESSPWHPFPQL
jgi:hypothetical protein